MQDNTIAVFMIMCLNQSVGALHAGRSIKKIIQTDLGSDEPRNSITTHLVETKNNPCGRTVNLGLHYPMSMFS